MRPLTVGQLKEKLTGVSDNTIIVRPSSDHSYRPASACVTTARYDRETESLGEDYDGATDDEDGKQINVVVIS